LQRQLDKHMPVIDLDWNSMSMLIQH
jgi:hypothetical protein